jgi:hypothetical protein
VSALSEPQADGDLTGVALTWASCTPVPMLFRIFWLRAHRRPSRKDHPHRCPPPQGERDAYGRGFLCSSDAVTREHSGLPEILEHWHSLSWSCARRTRCLPPYAVRNAKAACQPTWTPPFSKGSRRNLDRLSQPAGYANLAYYERSKSICVCVIGQALYPSSLCIFVRFRGCRRGAHR